jgi:hypothetical protein
MNSRRGSTGSFGPNAIQKKSHYFGDLEMPNPVQLFLFASLPFITIADGVPKFDISAVCRSEGGSKAALEKCADDEAQARDQLQPLWIESSAADKASCAEEAGIGDTPSYVDLLTCL